MPRLVRRRPLGERIRSYLSPWDFLLWFSEEIEGNDWDQLEKEWGLTIGFSLNLIFLIARANSRSSGSQALDDVFGDEEGIPWLAWLVSYNQAQFIFLVLFASYSLICHGYLGNPHCPYPFTCLHRKRRIHIFSEATLSVIRESY